MSFARAPLRSWSPIAFCLVSLASLALADWLPPSSSAVAAPNSAPPPRVRLTDLDGKPHLLGDTPNCKAVVVVFLSTECPISNGGIPVLNRLDQAFRKEPLEFYGVISDPAVSRAQAVAHRKEYAVAFPVLFDASGTLRRLLKPTHTPQAFVLNAGLEVRYSGSVDDRYVDLGRRKNKAVQNYLLDAIRSVLAGEQVEIARTKPVGCLVEAAPVTNAHAAVTYYRDVAPILRANCTFCHQPDGTSPFSLLEYEDARKRARQIALVTEKRFMPPWKPVDGFGHFRDERILTDGEIALLKQWAATGAAAGDPQDLPPTPIAVDGWQLGQPDVILQMPADFQIPADGEDIHQHFVIPTGLRENRLVAALEFQPGNPRVIHHASFYLDNTGTAQKIDDADPSLGYGVDPGPGFEAYGTLRSWLPGFTTERLPAGSGRIIPRSADIVMEIHYHPTGKAERDRSRLGLYFAPKNARQVVSEIQVFNLDLEIPAGAERHHHRATFTVPVDVTLLDAAPHMHLLGKEMKATAHFPDGHVEPLIWIRNWDYRWQGQYVYAKPVRLPGGTRIEVDAWYDNSAGNRLNPFSPPRTVYWGDASDAEMGICHFQYTCDTAADLRRVDQRYREAVIPQRLAHMKRQKARGEQARSGSVGP